MPDKAIGRWTINLRGEALAAMDDLLQIYSLPSAVVSAGVWLLRNLPAEQRNAAVAAFSTRGTDDPLDGPEQAIARLEAEIRALKAATQSVHKAAKRLSG